MDENYIKPNIPNMITVVIMVLVGMTIIRAVSGVVRQGMNKGVAVA